MCPSDNPTDMQQDFEAAKNRLRVVGVGGILESSDKHGMAEPKEADEDMNNSKKRMTFKNGVATFSAGKALVQPKSGITVFEIKGDTTKK